MHFNPRMSIFLNKKGKPVRSIIVRTLPILHSTGPFLGTLPKNMWSVGTLKITKPCEMPQYFLKNPGLLQILLKIPILSLKYSQIQSCIFTYFDPEPLA